MFLVLAAQRALDFAQHRAAGERVLGANCYYLIVILNSFVNFSPNSLTPFSIFWKVPHAHCFCSQVRMEPFAEAFVLRAVADETRKELMVCRVQKRL